MSDIPTLTAALAAHAAADPESPFLFWPQGWNWRWWSWRHTAELAARWQMQLAGLPPGSRAAFAGDVFPQAIVLDLAVQAAGLVPVPLDAVPWPGGEAVAATLHELGCAVWVAADGEGDGGEVRVHRAAAPEAGAGGEGVRGGPAGVLLRGAGGAWVEVRVPVVMAAARKVGEALGATAVAPVERDIAVLGRSLGEGAGRLLAAWALTAGAAVVLEADPVQRLETVLWARPTVFAGSRVEVQALDGRLAAAEARRSSVRWWRARGRRARLSLGRLRAVLQEEAPDPDEVERWARRGVRLVELPVVPAHSAL